MKLYKKSMLLLLCLAVFIFVSSLAGCNSGIPIVLNKDGITSFRIRDFCGLEKEISVTDRNKIIDMFNSANVRIELSKQMTGCTRGIKITYSNGDKVEAYFDAEDIYYSTNNSKFIMCKIDKDMCDLLRETFDKADLIPKEGITGFTITNFKDIEKVIGDDSDRNKIIDTLNGLKFGETINCCSDGDVIKITYANGYAIRLYGDGQLFSISTTYSQPMLCISDKNVYKIISDIYKKAGFDGIENKEKMIKDIIKENPEDITKIVFSNRIDKTVTKKEDIAKIMQLVNAFKLKELPKKYAKHFIQATGKFYAGEKEVLSIDFGYPVNINGIPYTYENDILDHQVYTIANFLEKNNISK